MCDRISEIAPDLCQRPYEANAGMLIEEGARMGHEPVHDLVRVLSLFYLYHRKEAIERSQEDPIPHICDALDRASEFVRRGMDFLPALGFERFGEQFSSVEEETGDHYGHLFSEFDPFHYFEEPLALLRARFERNDVPIEEFVGQDALDAGCGGGRYTFALGRLGFGRVVGLDVSSTGLAYAETRRPTHGTEEVSFTGGSVLSIPFDDNTFDFVFSNGVLHHTPDIPGGIAELVRVMKPGGHGFLYLIERPGGIYWDIIEILRCLVSDMSATFARSVFRLLGVPPNRRFFILDHIFVPINIRSTTTEIEEWLKEAGAASWRRLERGTDFDRVEQIRRKVPFATEKFGVGEQRYYFKK